MAFYGLPIHILRDLFLTARSFVKRLTAFVKYRRATRDMARYPDATVEEIQREDTCIICREEMTPWSVTNPTETIAGATNGENQAAHARPSHLVNERMRPKRLPCGHVLHLGCLKSWLERQQVCPTCRRPVVPAPQQGQGQGQGHRPGQGVAHQFPGNPQGPGAGDNGVQNPQNRNRNGNMRILGFGPLRFAFGQANMHEVAEALDRQEPVQQNGRARPRMYGLEVGFGRPRVPTDQGPSSSSGDTNIPYTTRLQNIEDQIMQEIYDLQVTHQEMRMIAYLQQELTRLRQSRALPPPANGAVSHNVNPYYVPPSSATPTPVIPNPNPAPAPALTPAVPTNVQRHVPALGVPAIPAGSADLPPGVTIPDGWTLLPLQRLDGPVNPPINTSSSTMGPAPPSVYHGDHSGSASFHPSSLSPSSSTTNHPLQAANPTNGTSSIATHRLSELTPTPYIARENPRPTPTANGDETQTPSASSSAQTTNTATTLRPNYQPFSSTVADNASGSTVPPSRSVTDSPVASAIGAEPTIITTPQLHEVEVQASSEQASSNSSSAQQQIEPEAEHATTGQDKGKAKAKAATVEEGTDDEDA